MKKIAILAFCLFSSVTFACTDFSGKYATVENETYSLIQNGCKSIQYIDDTESLTVVIDGQEHLIKEFDIPAGENGENVQVKIFASMTFIGERLVQNFRLSSLYSNGTQTNESLQSEIFLNQNRDIVNISRFSDGTSETYVDRRIE